MPRKKAVRKAVAVPCPKCGHLADPSGGRVNFCPACGEDLRGGGGDRTASALLIGQVVADRYRLIQLLGEGGMGAVYKAEHTRMGKALALKILRGDFAAEPGAVARFDTEARIVSRLSHPHTIGVFDFGELDDGEGFYLAMEYVPGKDLATVLRDGGPLPEARAAAIGAQILGSLGEAHDAGIVHRDMKPGNVMLTQARGEDFVKVLDFGIAKLRDEGPAATTTTSNAIVGTPNYLAPEQARGEAIDARADLYAVGCVLYELVGGRPPFVAPTPMAVVSAHLHQEPPALASHAPRVSRRYAEIVHRALRKRAGERFQSADDMRDALLALAEPSGTRRAPRPAAPSVTGELQIASRDDFRDFEQQVRRLKASRVVAPMTVALLLAAAGAVAWRWHDVYALLAREAPRVAALVPGELRPGGLFDGAEHEPNDVPARANPLAIPPGPDGRLAGGVALVRGFVGAKLSDTSGDVDIYRLEVPPIAGRKILVASFAGERPGEGIRGLDVALALNRERAAGDARTSAPLVAAANRGGPGRPETLAAAVDAGVYYLTVREAHDDATGPVEKPTDRYVLEVRLAEPRPGEEIEPNDGPDRVDAVHERYPEWRAVAERNPLAVASAVAGDTAPDDPDVYAVPAGGGDAPAVVVVIPSKELAPAARLWVPDAADVGTQRAEDRVRFEPAGDARPGEVLFVTIPAAAAGAAVDAPAVLLLQAAEGQGTYEVIALGDGAASAEAVLARVAALRDVGRPAQALELAAGFARHLPRSTARNDVLVLAGGLAAEARPAPDGVAPFDRAAQLLGAAIYEVDGAAVRYRAAFEAEVEGDDRRAEAAAVRVVRFAAPCTPEAIAARVDAFARRFPASEDLPGMRLWRARALDEASFLAGGKDVALRDAARLAWGDLAQGPAADEAKAALARLAAKGAPAEPPAKVCPDPGAR